MRVDCRKRVASRRKDKEVMEKVKDGKGTSESKGGWTQKGSWNGDWNVGFCKGDGGKGQGRKGTRVQVLQGYNIDGRHEQHLGLE